MTRNKNVSRLKGSGFASVALLAICATTLMGLWLCAPAAFAADELCSSCGQQVSISGDFTHRKDSASVSIEGVASNAAAFREEINGKSFTVSIAHLPAGKYTVVIGEVETLAGGPGERLFDVTSGDVTLAAGYDIAATAGGVRKVSYITGTVEHEDDAIKGALTVAFSAKQSTAKFNSIEVKDASGTSVISFNASELAEPFSAAASRAPVISEPAIWRDASQPLAARENDLIRRMSLAEKVAQLQNTAPAIQRLGLPRYDYWSEALHGVADAGIATVFPQAIAAAAAWDTELLHQESAAIGIEGRAKFNDYTAKNNGNSRGRYGLTFWSPNVNIFRDPRWGRGQETYGEDPFLSGTLGVAFIRGLQGDDPTYMLAMGCAKHFAVHSGPEPLRHRFDVDPSERDLYETYLPQFEMAVRDGHVGGVMGAYNSIFGVPACASSFLLTDILRNKWGFDGYIVSDCGAIHNIWAPNEHHYVATPEEAAAAAVKAGCNLCCGGDYTSLVLAVQKGLVTEKEIDGALAHTLWTRFRLGVFDPPEKCLYSKIGIDQNDTPEHRALSLKMAEETIVLLKNNGLLPLDRSKVKKIAVFGENAANERMLWGNYNGTASKSVTILNGIRDVAGTNVEVSFALGCPVVNRTGGGGGRGFGGQPAAPSRPAAELLAEALSNAANADILIYVGGISAQLEGEEGAGRGVSASEGFVGGDRTRIELPQVQEDFVHALHATGKPVVMINCSGSAMAMPWEVKNLPAIVQAWYPGEQGGLAVSEVLFGEVNPSGHLPVTFYSSTAELPAFTNYSMVSRTYRYYEGKPEFAFGYGLSYTKFAYSDGGLDAKTVAADGMAKVSFTVRNTGGRDGDEVAQVYFRHIGSKVAQPKLALCGFARVHLNRGEAGRVTVDVPVERLRYWDADKKQYVVEPGKYEFLIGAASDDIRVKLPMTITAH
jgi:beta-glucosidase